MRFADGSGRHRVWRYLGAPLLLVIPDICYAATTELSGLVEAEMSAGKNFQNQNVGDIKLATAAVAIDSEINEWYRAHVSLLYEEDQTDLEVDEGFIQSGNSFLGAFFFKAGQFYVPFGTFQSHMISDPLTLALGETRESAVVVTYDNGFILSGYLFNGALTKPGGENKVDNFGVSIGFVYRSDAWMLDIGGGYINNLGESDTLDQVITTNLDGNEVDYVPGFMGYLALQWGTFQIIGELIAADGEFNTGEVQTSKRSKPSATNVELGYTFSSGLNIAVGFQNTVDLAGLNGFPESRALLGLSYRINQGTTVAFEYASDSDYSQADGGSGNSASTATLQLATVF